MRVLLVTNDFPPRVGGIQSYLWNIYRGLGVDVRVLAPAFAGDAVFDRASGVEVVRWPRAVAWPTPALEKKVHELSRDADVVAFGAVLPMNLLAPKVERPVVVHTHGFEVAWARAPVMRQALRRIGRAASLITVVSDFTARFVDRAVGEAEKIHLLRTGVGLDRFSPDADGVTIRKRYDIDERPVVACVSRLVARKGQDRIIEAMPTVRARVPEATALIVGGGPMRARLEAKGIAHGRAPQQRAIAEVVSASAEGTRAAHRIQLNATLTRTQALAARLQGGLDDRAVDWRGSIESFALTGQSAFALAAPASLAVSAKRVELGDASLGPDGQPRACSRGRRVRRPGAWSPGTPRVAGDGPQAPG